MEIEISGACIEVNLNILMDCDKWMIIAKTTVHLLMKYIYPADYFRILMSLFTLISPMIITILYDIDVLYGSI